MPGDTPHITPRLTGGCQCGAVRYALAAHPTAMSICHCRMCQKAGGGPYMVFGRVPVTAVTWTRGAPSIFRSSTLATRGFCAGCGTPLTYQWKPDAISVTSGSLDNPKAIVPETRLGSESVLPWCEDIRALPIEPSDVSAGSSFVAYQHPDHDT